MTLTAWDAAARYFEPPARRWAAPGELAAELETRTVQTPALDLIDADYRCTRRKTRGPSACSGGSVSARHVERLVRAWVESIGGEVEQEAVRAALSDATRLSAEAEVRRLAAESERLEAAVRRLTVQLGEGLVEPGDYRNARTELEERRAAVVARMEESARAVRRADVDHGAVARRLAEEWDKLPLEHVRGLLRQQLHAVRVTTAARASGVPRAESRATVEVLPAWSDEWLRLPTLSH